MAFRYLTRVGGEAVAPIIERDLTAGATLKPGEPVILSTGKGTVERGIQESTDIIGVCNGIAPQRKFQPVQADFDAPTRVEIIAAIEGVVYEADFIGAGVENVNLDAVEVGVTTVDVASVDCGFIDLDTEDGPYRIVGVDPARQKVWVQVQPSVVTTPLPDED